MEGFGVFVGVSNRPSCLRVILGVLTWTKGLLQIWMLSVTFKLRSSRLLTIFIKTGREWTMVLLNTSVKM